MFSGCPSAKLFTPFFVFLLENVKFTRKAREVMEDNENEKRNRVQLAAALYRHVVG